ncbi:pyridine nucleotide-disulfide oxidoreductase-domain-containing protein [Aspergillus avenaceus]|uniref:Pyridine nucleotide-disulfide oxidoreductase-domain-containing protein n=1 Tax=Aspergillus avenaceus TaxID=36643 RepID=A0A5N6TLK2_ASPAV|nr:pyridine nucleotide-disulfide oxidoreductase-domain-containing protein [Aspergillus avenaceus]
MSQAGMPNTSLVSAEMIQRYLEAFAAEKGLMPHIRFNSWVQNVDRCALGWRLRANNCYYESKKLILACGTSSVPGGVHFRVEPGASVCHSRDVAANLPEIEASRHVVVVGAAKSAYDMTYLLCSLGKRVTWLMRPDGSGPMPMMPYKIAGMHIVAIGSTRLMSYLSPSIFNTQTWLASFFHRTAIGRWLTRMSWRFFNYMCDKTAGFWKANGMGILKPEPNELSCFWFTSALGMITKGDFWGTLQKGNLSVARDSIDVAREGSVLLRSGKVIECEYVISATGWGDHFGFLSPSLRAELGIPSYENEGEKHVFWEAYDRNAKESVLKSMPLLAESPKRGEVTPDLKLQWRLYNRCIPFECAQREDRSVAVLGQLYTVQTSTVAEIQALWAISYMLGELDLPDDKVMIREISEFQAWCGLRYSIFGERYPCAAFDWIGYLDRLLEDMGLRSHRKNNIFSEYFSPYGPETYRDCLQEYIAKRSNTSA